MAHLIDTTVRKQGAAFYADTAAWHGLGTVVDGAQTSADAIHLAGLDWKVEKRNLATTGPDGSWIPVPDNFAIVERYQASGLPASACSGELGRNRASRPVCQ